jgi:hypothetical protein
MGLDPGCHFSNFHIDNHILTAAGVLANLRMVLPEL